MRAVFTAPRDPEKLVLRDTAVPSPGSGEALVAVKAFSLNPGETRTALSAQSEYNPGWDYSGVVERAAVDGTGPKAGARVVGVSLRNAAWAEYVAAPTRLVAEIPDQVSFAAASALPVAGLTALAAIEKGGLVLGKSVLVTGASGGVGRFACQLGVAAGARVTALIRRPDLERELRDDGVAEIVVGDQSDLDAAARYDLVIDSVGGDSLAKSIKRLAPHGACVSCGNSTGDATTYNARDFYLIGGATIHGLFLGADFQYQPATPKLSALARLVADGRVRPPISIEESWVKTASVAERLVSRGVTGKAVLHVND
jgi:NADPH:quinone reductase-like Zn-dependent oxidoreductase